MGFKIREYISVVEDFIEDGVRMDFCAICVCFVNDLSGDVSE